MARPPRKILATRATKAAPAKVSGSPEINEAIREVADAVNEVADAGSPYVDVDLVTGTNRLSHALGRRPLGIIVVPRDPDPSFGFGYDPAQLSNPHPDRQAWLEVVGAPMRARVLFF